MENRTFFKLMLTFFISQVAMRALGFDVKKADVLKIMKDYDREASGKITFDDFNEVSKYIYNKPKRKLESCMWLERRQTSNVFAIM